MSSANGDYIGAESCINDVNHDGFDDVHIESASPVMKKQSDGRKKGQKREFPPPIPLLALVHNLSSHTPWELKRYYTGDGRLIIREEKATHGHFFRAHRDGGRLIIQLVTLDTDSPCLSAQQHDIPEQVLEVEATTTPSQAGDDEIDGDRTGQVSGDEGHNTLEAQEGLPRAANCNFNFNRVSSASSCLFETPAVHPIRTVNG